MRLVVAAPSPVLVLAGWVPRAVFLGSFPCSFSFSLDSIDILSVRVELFVISSVMSACLAGCQTHIVLELTWGPESFFNNL